MSKFSSTGGSGNICSYIKDLFKHLSQQCPALRKTREQRSCTSINWQDEGQPVDFPAGALCTEKMNLLNKTLYPVVQYSLQISTQPLFLFETRAMTCSTLMAWR